MATTQKKKTKKGPKNQKSNIGERAANGSMWLIIFPLISYFILNSIPDFTKHGNVNNSYKTLNSVLGFSTKDFFGNSNINKDTKSDNNWTKKELKVVAKCVCSESVFESYEGKLAVAQVIYNRHVNRDMPVTEVIFKKRQFSGIHNVQFKKEPSEDCLKAVKQIFIDKNFVLPSYVEYFANVEKSTDRQFINNILPFWYTKIGDHDFFYNARLKRYYDKTKL